MACILLFKFFSAFLLSSKFFIISSYYENYMDDRKKFVAENDEFNTDLKGGIMKINKMFNYNHNINHNLFLDELSEDEQEALCTGGTYTKGYNFREKENLNVYIDLQEKGAQTNQVDISFKYYPNFQKWNIKTFSPFYLLKLMEEQGFHFYKGVRLGDLVEDFVINQWEQCAEEFKCLLYVLNYYFVRIFNLNIYKAFNMWKTLLEDKFEFKSKKTIESI